MLPRGFEPLSGARKALMIGRTTPREHAFDHMDGLYLNVTDWTQRSYDTVTKLSSSSSCSSSTLANGVETGR